MTQKIEENSVFSPVFSEERRRRLVGREYGRLSNLFKNAPKETKDQSVRITQEAAFLRVACEEMRLTMQRDGVIETYKNGANQWGLKRSAAAESYDKFLTQYLRVLKQIREMLEAEGGDPDAAEIMQFIMGGK
jgi:hypothetical protein